MKGALYPKIFKDLLDGTMSVTSHTVRAALMKSDFSFNVADENWDNTHECTDLDYTAGGEVLPITAAQINVSTRTITISTSDSVTTFTELGDIMASYCVLYIDDGSTNQKLLACFDFEGSQSSQGAEFEINWGVVGGSPGELFKITTVDMPE